MRSARLVVAGLLPLGILLGHNAGYGLAGEHTHGYMTGGPLLPVAVLAAAAAVGIFSWYGFRHPYPRRWPPLSRVAAVQVTLFVAQEGVEHIVEGHGFAHLMASPAFRWGLAAQAVTAAILVVAACFAVATGQRLRILLGRPSARPRLTSCAPRRAMSAALSSSMPVTPASERGPPPFFVPA